MDTLKTRRLLIVSHVRLYRCDGQLYAYGPYSREVDIWADLFSEVVIAAPLRAVPPPGDAIPLTRKNIRPWPIYETGGDTLGAKLNQLLFLPAILRQLIQAIRATDAVHVRCPGNLGLLGIVLVPLFGRPRIAKYAGQWNGYPNERWAVRLQRRLLRSWWRAPVTVYGEWPNQPAHVIPFFTSMMTKAQVTTAVKVADRKVLDSPLRVLFSGRLAPEKRVSALLEAVKLSIDRGLSLELNIIGGGPEHDKLLHEVDRLDISHHVRFIGALPFDEALGWYEWAHCLVLPSVHSEGWPKVVAEAMCHGVLCIAVDHGQIASMLRGRGVLLEEGSSQEIASALEAIANNPAQFKPMMTESSRWARQYSLETLRSALGKLLSRHWRPISTSSDTSLFVQELD
jgi:glycosyltransferase involved in cell wall biosynthesis